MTPAEIKQRVAGWGRDDLPWNEVIDELAITYKGPDTVYELKAISNALGLGVTRIVHVTMLLSGAPLFALHQRWFFKDGDGGQFSLTSKEVQQVAAGDVTLLHPITGAVVTEPEDKIFFYYTPDKFAP